MNTSDFANHRFYARMEKSMRFMLKPSILQQIRAQKDRQSAHAFVLDILKNGARPSPSTLRKWNAACAALPLVTE